MAGYLAHLLEDASSVSSPSISSSNRFPADVGDAGEAQAGRALSNGLALGVEDLGLGHDVDDYARHGPQRNGRAHAPAADWRHESRHPGSPGMNPLRLAVPAVAGRVRRLRGRPEDRGRLSDNKFPVEHLMIVGTDLKRVERITGRLTWGAGSPRAACSPACGWGSSSA